MVDLLSKRLKNAKAELTNLKTAHNRGLGLLRIYCAKHLYEDDDIWPPGMFVGTITVDFPSDSPPYPFAYFVSPNPGNLMPYDFTSGIDVLSVRYENNGHRAIYECRIFYGSTDVYESTYYYSTVSPTRIRGVWSEE